MQAHFEIIRVYRDME